VASSVKTTYLACHDYGMGGIWILIDATSSEQVERVYPELKSCGGATPVDDRTDLGEYSVAPPL
jgi:hypothetical protein